MSIPLSVLLARGRALGRTQGPALHRSRCVGEIITHEATRKVASGRHSRREGAGLGWARDPFPEKMWHEQVPEDQGLQKGDKELQVHVDKVWKNARGGGGEYGEGTGEEGRGGLQLLWRALIPSGLPAPRPSLTRALS